MRFMVTGAFRDTGAPIQTTLDCPSESGARELASVMGIVVASVIPAAPVPVGATAPDAVAKGILLAIGFLLVAAVVVVVCVGFGLSLNGSFGGGDDPLAEWKSRQRQAP